MADKNEQTADIENQQNANCSHAAIEIIKKTIWNEASPEAVSPNLGLILFYSLL